ncbi:hypothetical protein B0T10DRAFT_459917 [Thelonectria olida]|uniref:Ankyrin n=1 Tax=Thelonectria olida TaxID=1576542 RepID=A0A9P8W6G8_9HYPO|nr:hypothetical protein B0T10DRAFT_459917 [Thelonectria olida]
MDECCSQTDARAIQQRDPSCPMSVKSRSTYRGSSWNLTDLSNALAMLQLSAAEFVECEIAFYAATRRLPKPYTQQNSPLRDRLDRLAAIIDDLSSALRSQVVTRLESEEDTEVRMALDAAILTLLDPLGGISVTPFPSSPITSRRPLILQSSMMVNNLEVRAAALAAEGKLVEALIYYTKCAVSAQQRPNLNLLGAIRLQDVPNLMASTAVKFGLVGDYANPNTWASPSMVHPALLRMSESETMEAVLIKNWLGYKGALSLALSERGKPHGVSSNDWKQEFRNICQRSTTQRQGLVGYTGLHLAVLLGMPEQVRLLLRSASFDLTMTDSYGYTALHLAAITGREDVCAVLLQAGGANVGITMKDYEGRTPLWYTAERGKYGMYKSVLDATLQHSTMSDICTQEDIYGQNLAQYAMTHGLDQFNMSILARWSQFPDLNNIKPPLGPIATLGLGKQDYYQKPRPSGNGLSPWAGPDV